MRAFATAIVAVGIVGLAACGGDGAGGELSAAEFRERADAICTDTAKKVDAVPQPRSLDEVETYFDRVVPIFRDQTDRLKELDPPDDLQEDWDRAMELQEDSVDVAEDAQAAAKDGDEGKIREALDRGGKNEEELHRLAARLGLKTCGRG
ncbi:MAG: hypothetical protein M3304_05760 [Actinomycetota bacterium]|nr:hypothetical protein [Actinomycetota bacterium]